MVISFCFVITLPPSLNQSVTLDGISFSVDDTTFYHHTASVNGIQMHYVIGGQGDPIVLLHGWPQTWYEWSHVIPALAKNYTVIVPDLRGLGDSSKPVTAGLLGLFHLSCRFYALSF